MSKGKVIIASSAGSIMVYRALAKMRTLPVSIENEPNIVAIPNYCWRLDLVHC